MCVNSPSSPERAADCLDPTSSAGHRLATSSGTNSAAECLSNESKTGFSRMHQCSRVTFESSLFEVTPAHIRDWLTSSQADPLARDSAKQARNLVSQTLETWSRLCSMSLKLCDLPLSSWRTPRVEPFDATCWSIYYQGLPIWGLTLRGELYPRKTPSGITAIQEFRRCSMRGSEPGYLPLPLPTLKASDATRGYCVPSVDGKRGMDLNWHMRKLPTLTRTDAHGHDYTRDRGEKGRERPTLVGCLKLPTLTCQDAHNNGSESQANRNRPPLNSCLGGRLNPQWTDWFMGFPIGWTALEPLEMPKYRQWLEQHGRP